MIRLSAIRLAMACALALLLAVGGGTRPAAAGDATFKLTDKARFSIIVKFYSQSRTWTWPGSNQHWTLADTGQHAFKLGCMVGEKICFGAAYAADDKTSWGVGFKGSKPCTDCCLTCGSNVSHAWNLTDTTPAPPPSFTCAHCNDGSCQCGNASAGALCAPHRGDDPSIGCIQQQ